MHTEWTDNPSATARPAKLVAEYTNHIKVRAELALDPDAADDMRSHANNVLARAIAGLPTPEQVN